MNHKNEKMKINLSSVVRFIMYCWSLLWGLVESYGSDLELELYESIDGFVTGTKKEPWLGSCGILEIWERLCWRDEVSGVYDNKMGY